MDQAELRSPLFTAREQPPVAVPPALNAQHHLIAGLELHRRFHADTGQRSGRDGKALDLIGKVAR